MTAFGWHGTGQTQRIDPPDFDRIPEYDSRAGDHFWIVTQVHKVNPAKFTDADPHNLPILDRETIVMITPPICFYCEQVFEPRLLRRRCGGASP